MRSLCMGVLCGDVFCDVSGGKGDLMRFKALTPERPVVEEA
jgi:hypothetical protein